MARVQVGIDVHIALPPNVHVSVGNYEPYYVGRVYYEPLRVWRPVYSFPVETSDGVVYRPYVYDGGRVVCHDYIPGQDGGYGQFVVEGHGHYNPHWYRGSRERYAYKRYDARHDNGRHHHGADHDRDDGEQSGRIAHHNDADHERR